VTSNSFSNNFHAQNTIKNSIKKENESKKNQKALNYIVLLRNYLHNGLMAAPP
jgi:hypothetical protein